MKRFHKNLPLSLISYSASVNLILSPYTSFPICWLPSDPIYPHHASAKLSSHLSLFGIILYFFILSVDYSFSLTCCLFLYALLWYALTGECFVLFVFFIVWKFKLWRKGGRIGLDLLSSSFYFPLVWSLSIIINPSYFLHFFWVLWCLIQDFSAQTLVAACRDFCRLNFFLIQLSHFNSFLNKNRIKFC